EKKRIGALLKQYFQKLNMPFMRGVAPIRRTLRYLQKGDIVLKDSVHIVSINYNTGAENHVGLREFVFWHLSQVQYKNPSVQIVTFKNMTPTPFIRCYLDNYEEIIMDVDSQSKEDIYDRFKRVLAKPQAQLQLEAKSSEDNPANFGATCSKHCICEVPGQVPCPSVVPLPKTMRGKYVFNPDLLNE
ncbi:hypothetical protein QYM36_003651, partial [Artemia franciscana]